MNNDQLFEELCAGVRYAEQQRVALKKRLDHGTVSSLGLTRNPQPSLTARDAVFADLEERMEFASGGAWYCEGRR